MIHGIGLIMQMDCCAACGDLLDDLSAINVGSCCYCAECGAEKQKGIIGPPLQSLPSIVRYYEEEADGRAVRVLEGE